MDLDDEVQGLLSTNLSSEDARIQDEESDSQSEESVNLLEKYR